MSGSNARAGLLIALGMLIGVGIGVFGSDETSAATAGFFTGRADVAADGLTGSISTPAWTYGFGPPAWTDAEGTLHTDGPPACLSALDSRSVNFAAVDVRVEGSAWRPVVWIDCRPAEDVDVP